MNKFIFFTIIIVFSYSKFNAQEKTTNEENGNDHYFVYLYKKAIESYKNLKVLTSDGHRKLAKSYYKLGENDLAEKAYEKLIQSTEGIFVEDYYDYAMVLKSNGKYEESNSQMEIFNSKKTNDLRLIDYNANKDNLSSMLFDNGKIKVQNLEMNTDAQDFGTSFFKDKIVFASSRSSIPMAKKSNINDLPFLNLYSSEVLAGELKAPVEFDKLLNGSLNEGPASFNKEGTLMAYTQNNSKLSKNELIVRLELIFMTNKDGKWSKSEPFKLNNKNYSVGHANLSADGNTMYFASDMPGGYGGSDLYRVTKNINGEWSNLENLGIKINTEGDELYPFFEEKTGNFLFTSNGRFGLGGFDIYINKTNSNGFQTSINLGAPINTQYDDFAAIVDDKMSRYYFSSNRKGGKGSDDIYTAMIPEKKDTTEKIAYKIDTPISIKKLKVLDNIIKEHKLDDIYFDIDKSDIRPDAIQTLNYIITLLNENPLMVVELGAHTDCRENEVYNQLLSNRRAISCLNYIKIRIKNPNRISGKGYGKTMLVNNCSCQLDKTCSEEDHKLNRRVEFVVIKW
jgi:outer membrane protein OmpA-like peptidoglycan-associated protein